jgi:hypothetical protein
MSEEYHKIGTTFRDEFLYLDNAGAAVTGKTNASFTKRVSKSGTGNQSTTGITIAEIDAVNNPGLYSVTVSGTTGFVSATGEYGLDIFDTSDSTKRWTMTIRTTSDGTGAGSWGDAAFTPTASDGRVVASAVALAGATVKFIDSTGALYVQTVSDSSGLYPTTYFPSGTTTYTISVQKSGYTTSSGTLTISGSTATGPGADISLTASSASSTFLASNLWAYALRMMKNASGTEADLLASQAVDDALEMISLARTWPYYHGDTAGMPARINLQAVYSTGTIAVANGSATVALTTGTWPTWAASGELLISGVWCPILTRDSNSQVTLRSTWNGTAQTAATYTLAEFSYTLPTDLQRLDAILDDKNRPWRSRPVSLATLQMQKSAITFGQTTPSLHAVAKDKLWVWPYPSAATLLNVLYYRRPAKLVSGSDTADWDPMHEALLRRAIDFQCALRTDCVAGSVEECRNNYFEAMDLAWAADKTAVDRDDESPMFGGQLWNQITP